MSVGSGPSVELYTIRVNSRMDTFAHGFPEGPDLEVAGSWLDGHKLFGVEPLRSYTVEHVILDISTVCVDEF